MSKSSHRPTTKQPGKVILIGAGPGDPGLLTLRGLQRLQSADVVLHDALLTAEMLELIPLSAEKLYVGKRSGQKHLTQEQINALIVEKAQPGRVVVRLKGGDPYIYGRGGEEAEHALQHGLQVEVVPGVSSAFGVPALAGIPVLHRDLARSVLLLHGRLLPPQRADLEVEEKALSGQSAPPEETRRRAIIIRHHHALAKETCPETRKPVDWKAICKAADTLVFLMFFDNRDAIQQGLIYGGRPLQQPVALISEGASIQQATFVSTVEHFVAECEGREVPSPSLLVVGEVVRFAERLNFYEQRPLLGTQIIFTTLAAERHALESAAAELGTLTHRLPLLNIPELAPSAPQRQRLVTELDAATHLLLMRAELAELAELALGRAKVDAEAFFRRTPILCPNRAVEKLVRRTGLQAVSLQTPLTPQSLRQQLDVPLDQARLVVLEHTDEWNELAEELEELGVRVWSIPLKGMQASPTAMEELERALDAANPKSPAHRLRSILIWENEATLRAALNHLGRTAEAFLKPAIHLCLDPACLETLQQRGLPFVSELRDLTEPSLLHALEPYQPLKGPLPEATMFPG